MSKSKSLRAVKADAVENLFDEAALRFPGERVLPCVARASTI